MGKGQCDVFASTELSDRRVSLIYGQESLATSIYRLDDMCCRTLDNLGCYVILSSSGPHWASAEDSC